MSIVFDNYFFKKHPTKAIPLGQDIFLMNIAWAHEWEAEWIKLARGQDADPYVVGFVTPISVSSISDTALNIPWYPNSRRHDPNREQACQSLCCSNAHNLDASFKCPIASLRSQSLHS